MKRVIIEIDDTYGEILSITASGRVGATLNVNTLAINLWKTNKVKIDKDGKQSLSYDEQSEDNNDGKG